MSVCTAVHTETAAQCVHTLDTRTAVPILEVRVCASPRFVCGTDQDVITRWHILSGVFGGYGGHDIAAAGGG